MNDRLDTFVIRT